MRAFVNLLIDTDEFEEPTKLEEYILEIISDANPELSVVWSKSKEAND